MSINQKLVFHVVSVVVLLAIFQVLVGFKMSVPTAIFLLALLVIDVVGHLWALLTVKRDINKIVDGMRSISEGNLSLSIPQTGVGEVAEMQAAMQDVVTYLHGVARVAEAVGRGDLRQQVVIKGERDQLGMAVQKMMDNMREIVRHVYQAARNVDHGAVEIGDTTENLIRTMSLQAGKSDESASMIGDMTVTLKSLDDNARALGNRVILVREKSNQLASAASDTSLSISRLASSVQQVATHVENANQVSEQASRTANAGEDAVAKTIAGMKAISESMSGIRSTIRVLDERSGAIGAIIEVIDDIAEQTNLLALNAAIEAARAGEAGRGFAVVADEVRKLAERSAKATREIGDLIKGIQSETAQAVSVTQQSASKVDEGAQLASHTGEVLGQIKQAAVEVANLLREVSLSTSEQAKASQQIVAASAQMASLNQDVTGAILEMDAIANSVTRATSDQRRGADLAIESIDRLNTEAQKAACASQQMSGAASSLNVEAKSLLEAVAHFKLDDDYKPALRPGRAVALIR